MNLIKVILINVGITFGLLGRLLMAPPILYKIQLLVSKNDGRTTKDERSNLAIYEQVLWAETFFIENNEIPTIYHDYITWRRDDYTGETINIVDGVRATVSSQAQNSEHIQYYFFGGSTTWGAGVNDANTYPSLFAQLTDSNVTNLGEGAYIARQSLAYLNNLVINESLSDMSGKHIVFYDGVNDVALRCRSEISGLGTGREYQIQNKLLQKSDDKYSFLATFYQLTEFLVAFTKRLGIVNAAQTYNCASNPERAQEVATTLVDTWLAASDLVRRRGGDFTAILQPLAYLGSPITNYLNLTNDDDIALKAQYKAVYPLIRKIAETRNIRFIDLTHVYDGCDNCYIDFCHVGPQAHRILVRELIKDLAQ